MRNKTEIISGFNLSENQQRAYVLVFYFTWSCFFSGYINALGRAKWISIIVFIYQEIIMTIARVTEVTASSKKSFEDAVERGVARADKTLKSVKGAWVKDQEVSIKDGKVTEFRVKMKITFVLEE